MKITSDEQRLIDREERKLESRKRARNERKPSTIDSLEPPAREGSQRVPGFLQPCHITPVLPTCDREAPYGRDPETDRPLLPIKPDAVLHADLMARDLERLPIEKRCIHRNDPSACFLCRPTNVSTQSSPPSPAQKSKQTSVGTLSPTAEQLEAAARRMLGIPEKAGVPVRTYNWKTSAPWYASAAEKKRHSVYEKPKAPVERRPRFLKILSLTENDILLWLELDSVLYGQQGVDFVECDKKWVKRPRAITNADIRQQEIQVAKDEIRALVKDLEDVKKNSFAHDGLTPQKRAALKRTLPKTIEERNQKLGALKRKKIEPDPPDQFDRVEIPGTEHTVTRYSGDPIPGDDIRCYREVVSLTRPFSDEWRKFENEVISNACRTIWCPLPKIAKDYPELLRSCGRRVVVTDAPEDLSENAVIAQTSGGQINGHIVSAGYTASGRPRGLTSFRSDETSIKITGPSEEPIGDGPDYDISDDSVEL